MLVSTLFSYIYTFLVVLNFVSHLRWIKLFPSLFMINFVYFCATAQFGQQPRYIKAGWIGVS